MRGSRPSYAVVTGVVTGLAVFGGLLRLAQLGVPKPAGLEALGAGDFVRQGAGQRIKWRPLGPDAIAEARRTEKPILLLLGGMWSEEGRLADQLIFTDEDVAGFITRNFLPVRADVDRHPHLLNAYLPRQRAQLPVGPGFQIAFLTPQGRLYDYYGRRGFVPFDPPLFVPELAAARSTYDGLPLDGSHNPQADELQALREPERYGPPDPEDLLVRLRESQGMDGRFSIEQSGTLRTSLYAFLLRTGDQEVFRKAIAPILNSSLVDWLDGGFFRRGHSNSLREIDFDKLAVRNAEMMRILTDAAFLLGEPHYEQIAKRTFDSLATDLASGRYSVTARIGDEDLRGRSRRSSFSFREIQTYWGGGILDVEEARWASEKMGLEPRHNPQMAIRVRDLSVMDDPKFETTLQKLREARLNRDWSTTTRPYANVNGRVAAAMIYCARLWNDPDREAIASGHLQAADEFRSGSDVDHSLEVQLGDEPFLGDYLGLAEAGLNEFQTTGSPAALAAGVKVLTRALDLFKTDLVGYVTEIPLRNQPGVLQDVASPELLDHVNESSTARFARLCIVYGRLLQGGKERQLGARFSRFGDAILNQFGTIAAGLRTSAAGLYHAQQISQQTTMVISAGPRDAEMTLDVLRIEPRALAFPCSDIARPDIGKRAPGIYIARGGDVEGPMTAQEAAGRAID